MTARPFRCPTCRTPVAKTAEDFPFCSERCRMADLGGWFDERYRVSRPLTPLQRLAMEEEGELDEFASEQDE